jgi:hypothetical protein
VTAREQRDQQLIDNVSLTDDDPCNLIAQPRGQLAEPVDKLELSLDAAPTLVRQRRR